MRKVLLIALVAAGLGSVEASAATYVQHVCRVGGEPVAAEGVGFTSSSGTTWGDQCLSGGQLDASLTSKQAGSFVDITYTPPVDTRVAGITVERYVDYVGPNGGSYSLSGTPDSCADPTCYGLGGEVSYRDLDLASTTFRIACPDQEPCGAGGSPQLVIRRADFALRDDFLPVVSAALPAGPLAGIVEVPFDATDRGGGVFQSEIVIDGESIGRQPVDDNGGSCVIPFVRPAPCRLSTSGKARFDTSIVPDGEHELVLNVYDATGTNKASTDPIKVLIRNGAGSAAPPTSGSAAVPLPAGARIVPKRPRKNVRGVAGKPTVVRGRLVDADGNAVANAPVSAYAAVDVPGAKEVPVAGATTGPKGGFRIVLPAGPSRRVTVKAAEGVVWTFRVSVPAPIRLLPSRKHLDNGEKLILSAYLLGAKAPPGSADVNFQVKIGRKWRTFATSGFDSKGLARIGHRFRVTYHRMTYRFRAVTKKRRGFPYADAHSPLVSVQVN